MTKSSLHFSLLVQNFLSKSTQTGLGLEERCTILLLHIWKCLVHPGPATEAQAWIVYLLRFLGLFQEGHFINSEGETTGGASSPELVRWSEEQSMHLSLLQTQTWLSSRRGWWKSSTLDTKPNLSSCYLKSMSDTRAAAHQDTFLSSLAFQKSSLLPLAGLQLFGTGQSIPRASMIPLQC